MRARPIVVSAAAAIAIPVAGILALAATKSDTLAIRRVTTIAAPPAKIFALIDDFHQWKIWAPQDL